LFLRAILLFLLFVFGPFFCPLYPANGQL